MLIVDILQIKRTREKMSSKAIYILTFPSRVGRYKVGKHTGTQKKLHNRYKTYDPQVKILYFQPHPDPQLIENAIREKYKAFCEKHQNGKYSEWYTCKYEQLEKDVEYFRQTLIPRSNLGRTTSVQKIGSIPTTSTKELTLWERIKTLFW